MELERRCVPLREVRLKGDGGSILEGRGIVYNEWTDMGGWLERVAVGAADDSISTDDIKSLFNHDANYPLGYNKADPPTLRLAADAAGVSYETDLPETSYAADLKVSVRRGDIHGNSFGFYTLEDRWGTIDGKEYRELTRVQVVDIGPVTFPQYVQTDLALRAAFGRVGINSEELYLALLKVGNHDLSVEERDTIRAYIEALDKHLPHEQGGAPGSEEKAGRLTLMRMRLEMAERTIR